MPDAAAFCPRCGRRMIAAPAAQGKVGFLRENIAGGLAYVALVPAIFFLVKEPFKENHFVRFHSWQSIYLAISGFVAGVVLRTLFYVLSFIPYGGQLLGWLAMIVVAIGWLLLWLVVVVKALQGEFFKLPLIGDFAERV